MKNSIMTKHRILSGMCFVLLLLACNLAQAIPPATPTVSAITFPTDTPTSAVILSSDATPMVDVPAANQCTAAPAGLVGWWPGNDDARDVVAGHDGRLNDGAGFAAGKVGQAFSFDDRGSVDIPRVGGLEIKRGTIEFWMKPDPENEMDRCCQGLVGTEYFLVDISRGWSMVTGVNFAINNGNLFKSTSDENNAAFPVPADEWSFIVATYDGQHLRLFVNGQEVQSLEHRGKMAPAFPDSFLIIGSE
ncbi:MAG TPA: LamG domain-containing protein, partial [Anaerolineales bacterium]|nr:LamG domain-containing protein [Anaerolineales bacterium]